MNKKRLLKIIPYLATAVVFGVLFYNVEFSRVWIALKGISPGWLLLGLLISIISNLFLQTAKWHRILINLNLRIRFWELLSVYIGSSPLKVLTPMKSGMFLRAVYLKNRYGFSFADGSYSLILALLLNLAAALLFVIFTSILAEISDITYIWAGMAVIAGAGAVLWLNHKQKLKVRQPLKNLALPIMYSILLIFFELVNFKVLSLSLGVSIPFNEIMLLGAVIIVLSNAPVTVHGLGAREAMTCFFFAKYAGFEELLSVGIAVSAVEYIFPMIIGLFWTKTFLSKMGKGDS